MKKLFLASLAKITLDKATLHEKIRTEWENRGYELKFLTNNQAIIIDGDIFTVVEV